MNRAYVPALLALLAAAACGGGTTPTDPTIAEPGSGSYNVRIGAAGSPPSGNTSYVGRQVSTNWDQDISLIYLGPDKTNEPLLSLTMTLGDSTSTPNVSNVATATLTTSKVRVGTGEELGGRSYKLTGGVIEFTVGVNFIEGSLQLEMERLLIHPEDQPETILVSGSFRAVAK